MCGNTMPGAAAPKTFSTPSTGNPAPIASPKPAVPAAPRNLATPAPITGAGEPVLPKAPSFNPGAGMAGLPKMHKGGTIPETGPYVMKKGEKVLTPEHQRELLDAFQSVKRVLAEPDSEPEDPAKDIQAMMIKRDKKDPTKFAVSHKTDGQKAEEFSVHGSDLPAHVSKHFKLNDETTKD